MVFMIRKLTLFLLTACMLLTLTACGGNAEDEGGSQSDSEGLQSAQSQGSSGQESGDTSDGDLQPIALQGGSDQESAEAVPLDAKLAGKTAQDESQWYSFTTDTTENAHIPRSRPVQSGTRRPATCACGSMTSLARPSMTPMAPH